MSAPAQPIEGNVERSRSRLRTIPALPRPGDTIAGKYALVRLIGEGGMGVVYEATHVRLQQRLAIKVLRPDVPDFGGVVERFEREARSAAQLQSIHTARVIDVDVLPNGLPYIVLEYLEGRDLDAELAQTGPMPIEEAIDVVLQVADAMAEAHALGIVHRDLKPSNLFVCRVADQPRRVIKVLDFGISKTENEDHRLTPSHAYFGTPYYAAPEQLRAATNADARSDVWSLGAILFELLTGRTPFVGTPTAVIAKVASDPVPWPTELRPDLPAELARVVMCAMQRDPQRRFQNMRELARALEPFGPKQTVAQAVADAPRGRGKLGEILIADGLLTPVDLERALDEQRRSGKLLGRVLLDMHLLSQADLLTALAKQQGVIVTPEGPGSIEKERMEREAATISPVAGARRSGRSVPRRRYVPWLVAALVGVSLVVWTAAVITAHSKSASSPAGLVGVASPSELPAVALEPSASSASLPTPQPTGDSAAAASAPRPVSAARSVPATAAGPHGPAARSAPFEPTGI